SEEREDVFDRAADRGGAEGRDEDSAPGGDGGGWEGEPGGGDCAADDGAGGGAEELRADRVGVSVRSDQGDQSAGGEVERERAAGRDDHDRQYSDRERERGGAPG